MKDIKIFIAVTQIMVSTAWAGVEKTDNQETYAIVPMVGTTAYSLEGAPIESTSKGGVSAGVAYQKTLDNTWEAQIGLNYFETSAQLGFLAPVDIEVKNIGIPMKAKYYFNKQPTEVFSWYLTGALTPSFIMAATAAGEDIKSDVNSTALFGSAGVGTDITSDAGRLSVDLTYNRGLSQLNKNTDGYFAGWQLGLGYSIQL